MNSLDFHVLMLSEGFDPIVVLLIVRLLLSATIAILFFIEPRKCGGRNRLVHWLLASVFLGGTASAWVRAQARMAQIAAGTGQYIPVQLMLVASEAIVVAIEIALVAVLVYQEFNTKTKENYKLPHSRCQFCEYNGDGECENASVGSPRQFSDTLK